MWKLKFRAETPQHEKTATTTKVFLCLFERIRKKLICLLSLNKYIFKSLSVLNVPPFVTLEVYFDCALQNDVFLID